MTPLKAIRAKCLDCNYTANEVRLCPCTDCPLWPFRFGKNPYRKVSDKQKAKGAANLAKWREENK